MSYLTFEREDAEHTERYGEEETTTEAQWCYSCQRTVTECEHDERLKKKSEMQTLVCSCGSRTCGAISVFGLSIPTFGEQIEPIPTQYARDMRARDIKSSGGI